jgi:hypothetical protein
VVLQFAFLAVGFLYWARIERVVRKKARKATVAVKKASARVTLTIPWLILH